MTPPTLMREAIFTVHINENGIADERVIRACYFVTEDRMVIFKGPSHEQVFAVNIDCFMSVQVTEIDA